MATAVKRACDACHRRKVKCDGINPCKNCASSQLSCTYNAIPQKKGPKGSRAKVITELRANQRQTSLSAKVQNVMMNGITSPPCSPTLAPTPGLLAPEMVKGCVDFFFAHMHPTMPILHRQRLEQQAMYMDQSLDTYCLLTSLCAFVLLQPGMNMPGSDPYSMDSMPGANLVSSTLLMEETLRVRKAYDYLDSPTLNSLSTSYFLYGCHLKLTLHDKAWFHLREATTLAHMIGMNEESTYPQYDNIESSTRRRLYWLLFVAERSYALERRRPLTLDANINLPSPSDDPTDPSAHELGGFLNLINLFRPYDEVLVPLWNKTRRECAPSYLSALQKQAQDVLPPYLNGIQAQFAELHANQTWLKNTTWQLSVASGSGNESGLPYTSLVDITRDLLPMVSHLPGNLGLQGLGFVEKLLSITGSLIGFLALQPTTRVAFATGPREHLHQILNILTVIRSNGDYSYLPLLLSKVHDVLPKLASPMLQNAPENVACNLDIDIFDGFGNAGMAQPPVFSNDDYDNKYAVARMEDMSADSASSNGGPSSNDMNSPFVSSPAIMSPGMDMSHSLQTDYASMPEMQQHPQHQHPPISSFQNLGSQMQGLSGGNANPPPNINLGSQIHLGQGLGTTMGQSVNGNGMMGRPPPQPQRANSFATGPQQIRTVGDFHALQRANSDMNNTMGSMGMNSMGTELDFNTLPR
ncbi:putative maltose fermentation regulatory protein [Podospora didyma]|uniref:Maltose fermentation regulatory protein n=1 Tax=Podospora didyma TaxID=330526 RepID=A0AAE0N4M4_9PEZI|nr:putative maltose fermentation regulatory protein [Podospora didyma]